MLVLATNNPGKIAEIEAMLKPYGLTAASARSLGFTREIAETGRTFAENAEIKALAIARALNLPALADDSGLCVAALRGAPGVLSARFAGVQASDEANNQHLLSALRGIDGRGACFACAMVCAKPDGSFILAQGRLEGEIARHPCGGNGFGYDPLFVLPASGLTLGQLSAEEKNAVSHRARALADLMTRLPAFLNL